MARCIFYMFDQNTESFDLNETRVLFNCKVSILVFIHNFKIFFAWTWKRHFILTKLILKLMKTKLLYRQFIDLAKLLHKLQFRPKLILNHHHHCRNQRWRVEDISPQRSFSCSLLGEGDHNDHKFLQMQELHKNQQNQPNFHCLFLA